MMRLPWFARTWNLKTAKYRLAHFNQFLLLIVLILGPMLPSMLYVSLPEQFVLPVAEKSRFTSHLAVLAARQAASINSLQNELLHPLLPVRREPLDVRAPVTSLRQPNAVLTKKSWIPARNTAFYDVSIRKTRGATPLNSTVSKYVSSCANRSISLSADPQHRRRLATNALARLRGFLYSSRFEPSESLVFPVEAIYFVNSSALSGNILEELRKTSNLTHVHLPSDIFTSLKHEFLRQRASNATRAPGRASQQWRSSWLPFSQISASFSDRPDLMKLPANEVLYRNNPQLQLFVQNVNAWYQKRGYVFAEVLSHPILVFSENQLQVSLCFHVVEPKIATQPVKLYFYRRKSHFFSPLRARCLSSSSIPLSSSSPSNYIPKVAATNETHPTEKNANPSSHEKVLFGHTPSSLHATPSLCQTEDSLLSTKGRTRPSTIAKHLQLTAGQPFRWDDRRWNELLFSGIFSDAHASAVILSDSSIQMHVFVVEQPSFKFEPGVSKGFSSTKDLALELTLIDQNLLGTGKTLASEIKHTALFSSEPVFGVYLRFLNDRLSLLNGTAFRLDLLREYNFQTPASVSPPNPLFTTPFKTAPSAGQNPLEERKRVFPIPTESPAEARGLLWTGIVGSWIRNFSPHRLVSSPLLCVFNASFLRRHTLQPFQPCTDGVFQRTPSFLPPSSSFVVLQNGEPRCVSAASLASSLSDHDCCKVEAVFQLQKPAPLTHARLSMAFGIFTKRGKNGNAASPTVHRSDSSIRTWQSFKNGIRQHLNQICEDGCQFGRSLMDVKANGQSMLFSTMKFQVGLRVYLQALGKVASSLQEGGATPAFSPPSSFRSESSPFTHLPVIKEYPVAEESQWTSLLRRWKKAASTIGAVKSSSVSTKKISISSHASTEKITDPKNLPAAVSLLKRSRTHFLGWNQSYIENSSELRVRNLSLWMTLMALKALPMPYLRTLCHSIASQTNALAAKGLPPAEQLFIGGPKSLRGFTTRQLGPYEAVLSCLNDLWLPLRMERLGLSPSLTVEVGIVADYSIGLIRLSPSHSHLFPPSLTCKKSTHPSEISTVGDSNTITPKNYPSSPNATFNGGLNSDYTGDISFWGGNRWKIASSLGLGLKLGNMGFFVVHPLGKEIKPSSLKFHLYLTQQPQ
ncbi:hypothetical protein IE077_002004 [Cardiosporidium cionae]|uniref:Transmembrane protein n=1 Tax=Cardiosporidium cionae TaxID=476202 RepID=A0ABQ7JBR1_9APIC|nr:hypothetical protein IE077_002004 [Cardiosporidium cionae]|eukprot:KAF8821451.1 hypothetical protein IE077_002004 [Cardiosporidium cionae]